MDLAREAQRHVRAIEKDYMISIADSVNKTRNLSPNDLKGLVAYLYDEQRKPVTDNPYVELVKSTIAGWLYNNLPSLITGATRNGEVTIRSKRGYDDYSLDTLPTF